MTVSVSHIRHALQESYSAQEAANLSRIVCCEMLGQTAVDYYLGKDMILSPKEMQDLDTILARLRNFEPITVMCRAPPVFWNAPTMWPPAC